MPCSCCGGGLHFTNAAHGIKISPKVLEEFVRKVYRGYDVSKEIEPTIWRAVLEQINEATVEGLSKSKVATHDKRFLRALRHSNEVFTAFKVHSMGVKMAERLYDAKGRLRSFAEFKQAVRPIASHQVGAWLRTEYNTAVRRAHLAADWQGFEANSDLFPNLRWMPTTSPNAEGSHKVYWEKKLTLPVDDPFWKKHHPGDRWNCKCSLEPTDAPATQGWDEGQGTAPQRGLDSNPKDGQLFSQSHPYFPAKCSQCWAYKQAKGMKNALERVFSNRVKDCYNCPFIEGCVDRAKLAKLIEERRKEYLRLKDDPNYIDVQFDPKTGGLKATHREHNFDKAKGYYEKEVRDVGYNNGHSVILEPEDHTVHKGKNTEGFWDNMRFEIAGAETNKSSNIRNALKHCATKPLTEVAVVFFPNEFDLEVFKDGLKRYNGLKGTSQHKKFKAIYCIHNKKIVYTIK